MITDFSIKRPVFAKVISLLLICFGLVSFERLSLREFPNIDPPIVTIEVEYPGASADIVETRITEIIEERVSGIEGIELIESSSSDGLSKVSIEFSINRDIDSAANDIRDRIAKVADDLPEEAEPAEVQKVDSNDDVIIWQNLTSTNLSLPELTDYAQRFLVDQYSALNGVARVRVGGGLNYALRIWLDRNKMAARNISVSDVENALRSENVELPAGSLESKNVMFQARIDRNFKRADDFNKLVIAEGKDGYLIKLSDIGRVELGVEESRTLFRGNTVPMVGLGVIRQSKANTIEVADAVENLTDKLNKTLPEGMFIEKSYNAAIFIKSSISEVYKTLFIAIICVIFVIYLFSGSIRAMIIPAITVPISLVATFTMIYLLGFSINLLTLLALVLAIGLVVDDTIVMLENILRRINEKNEKPLIASFIGSRQVAFAIIATTLVLISVFTPITFLKGDIGRLFTEFAVTISAALIFSSIVALTLSPVLSSILLNEKAQKHNFIIENIEKFVSFLKGKYIKLLSICIAKYKITLLIFISLMAIILLLIPQMKIEFAPKEDRGSFIILVNGPEGASFEFIKKYMDEIEDLLMPYVENNEVNRLLLRAPRSFGNAENFNDGLVIINLHDWSKRRSGFVIMNEIRQKLSHLPGVRIIPVMRQPLGGGINKPLQVVLGGSSHEELAKYRDIIFEKLNQNNFGLIGVDSDYKETRPQISFSINYERASDLGVTISEIGRTLETMLGGRIVTNFIRNGEEYDVIIEGERNDQTSFNDIMNIYVKSNRTGNLIPISNLVNISEYGSAQTISRFNRIRAITIDANLSDNLTLGEAVDKMNQLISESLPKDVIIDYKGQTRDYLNSNNSIIFVLVMGLIIIFLILAAQFESWINPLVIMLTVPLSIGGGLFGLIITGASLNIYSQIGLLMLIGLSAKNGILIIEFINQLRNEGVEFYESIIQACKIRFRPIIMTSLTSVAGTIPLLISSGAGYETRLVIGIVLFFGIIFATIFTLFFVPVFYNLLARNTKSSNHIQQILEKEMP